jgi:hypothetical protein
MRSLWLSEGPATPRVKLHSSPHHANINLRARASICGFGGEYIVCRQRTTDTLERKLANGFDGDGVFDRHQNARANQNLTRLGLALHADRAQGVTAIAAFLPR